MSQFPKVAAEVVHPQLASIPIKQAGNVNEKRQELCSGEAFLQDNIPVLVHPDQMKDRLS